MKERPYISIPNDIISENEESPDSSDKSSSDYDDEDFSTEIETTEEEILLSSSSDDQGTPSESSRVTKTKGKNVKNTKVKNKKFMRKNYSNKKTPQDSEIQLKKFRHVGNKLSPNTPPIEFFNIFFDDDFTDVIVYQSNLNNTQRSIDGYQLPTNKQSSSEKSFQSIKPVSKTEIKNIFGIIFYMGVCKYPNRRMYWGQNT